MKPFEIHFWWKDQSKIETAWSALSTWSQYSIYLIPLGNNIQLNSIQKKWNRSINSKIWISILIALIFLRIVITFYIYSRSDGNRNTKHVHTVVFMVVSKTFLFHLLYTIHIIGLRLMFVVRQWSELNARGREIPLIQLYLAPMHAAFNFRMWCYWMCHCELIQTTTTTYLCSRFYVKLHYTDLGY